MSLLTCPDCGTQVSDHAPACPRCGRPLHGMQGGHPGGYPQGQMPKKGMSVAAIILIVTGVVIIPILCILGILAIYGTRKYIANAKTAEAKNTLGQLAKDAVVAYEREAPGEALGEDEPVTRRLCPSASKAVPADRNLVSGKKYQSSASDWATDASRDAGFACLKFEMNAPQYFQYEYEATATGFVARAHGDLDGDGVFSTFEIKGQIVGERLVISPAIEETSPEE